MSLSKDAGHLFRFACLFVLAFVVFLVVRHFVVPKSFGKYGHYRGAAIAEIAASPRALRRPPDLRGLPLRYRRHQERRQARACELRGLPRPAGKARRRPRSIQPAKLDTATLCVRCHAASAARPKDFPQVNAADHSNGIPCETCHQPHTPAIESAAGGAK